MGLRNLENAYANFFRGGGSFDYNGDGKVELLYPKVVGVCGSGIADPEGWIGRIPSPGEKGEWLIDCDRKFVGLKYKVVKETELRKQKGR